MTIDVQAALTIVRAAGYTVSKPRPKKRTANRVGPTCVVQFKNGEVCRMTTWCDDVAPDYARGERLCRHALHSRLNYRFRQYGSVSRRRLAGYAQAAPIASIHFERDGQRIAA